MASSTLKPSTEPTKREIPLAISIIRRKQEVQLKRTEKLTDGGQKYDVSGESATKTRPAEIGALITAPFKLDDWYLTNLLGKGNYSKVYQGRNIPRGLFHAVKVESKYRKVDYISHEVTILRTLMYPKELPHIPKPLAYSKQGAINYFAMTLLGETLSDLKKKCPEGKLEPGTWSRIGLQVLYALKSIHEKGIIHRAIRPSKLMMGSDEDEKRWRLVHVIDFKCARQWAYAQDPANEGQMYARPLRKAVRFEGSLYFSSPCAHLGYDLGRKDDLWSLLFTLVDLNGKLPWIGEKDHDNLAKLKANGSIVLCDMPPEFSGLIDHLIKTGPLQKPNYHMFFTILRDVLVSSGETAASKYTFENFELLKDDLQCRKKGAWEEETGEFFAKDLIKINGSDQCYKKKEEWKNPNVNRFVPVEDLVQEDENKAYLKVPAEREAEEKAKAQDSKLKEKIESEKNKTKLLYEFRPINGEEKTGIRREGYQVGVEEDVKMEKARRAEEKEEREENYLDKESVRERRERQKNRNYDDVPKGKPEEFNVNFQDILKKFNSGPEENSKKEEDNADVDEALQNE